jgi:hypothetical protein
MKKILNYGHTEENFLQYNQINLTEKTWWPPQILSYLRQELSNYRDFTG